MKKVLLGLSGGVDSAVSAYLLKKQGYDVTAGFMVNYIDEENSNCSTKIDMEMSNKVANFLNIPFFKFNYIKEYEKKVLNYMFKGYKKGITPNPDIICNNEIKFKIFLQEAIMLGFEAIATGHYAQIISKNNVFFLKKGVDENKDQSYFLAGLSQKQLSKSIFPIGHLRKEEVRMIAKNIGLLNADRKDSQGLCFVGKINFYKFLEKKIKKKYGNIINTSGQILGKHYGCSFYTIGQRKGLNIGGLSKPVFVIRKDIEKNELIVGTDEDAELYNNELIFTNIHFLSGKIKFPFIGKAKIRYRQQDQDCVISKIDNDIYKAKFKNLQRAITPGQIIAIYDENNFLVASGIILGYEYLAK